MPASTALGADAPAPMRVISRGVPAYTNDRCAGSSSPALANDASYDTQWRGCDTPSSGAPIYLAYDLASVPAATRGRVLVAWYNDPTTSPYDHTYVGQAAYNIPSSYVLQASAAAGGAVPTSGWVTLASVSANVFHSRQHSIDLTGYNWFRMSVTASDGSSGNTGLSVNVDIHDASAGTGDDWIFFGDSITQAGMAHNSLSGSGGSGTWAQLVNASNASYFPAFENGGIGGTLSADAVSNINAWLAVFPGRYVGLAYGSNDAGYSVSPTTFYDNYVTLIQAVLGAGKIPVIPKIPWSCNAGVQANTPSLNQRIDALYSAYPSVVRGPDLWSYFQSNQGLISGDCLHPSNAGYAGMRQQWANAMLGSVYGATTPPPPPPPPSNLVSNAGFESGGTGWSLAPSASIDSVASNAHSGTRSLRLAATGAWQGSWQSFPVTAGQSYALSAWERSSTSGGYISVFSFNSSWTQLDQGTHLVFPAGTAWTQRSGTYVPPSGTAYALIGAQSSGAGTFYFDDLSLGGNAAPPALQITAVQTGSIGATSAVITWQTNNAASSRVDYGTTAAYGSAVTSASLVSTHSLTVSGLSPSTTYHYKVTSVDGASQTASSADGIFTTSAQAATNLVANPGFESGGTGWSLASTASIDAVASNAHSGTRSLRLAATGAWQGSWQSFAVTPGLTYDFSAWERSSASGGFLSVFSFNASWAQIDQGTHLVYGAGAAWTQLSGTYVPPAGTAYALIGVQSSGAGTFYFDDLTLSRR